MSRPMIMAAVLAVFGSSGAGVCTNGTFAARLESSAGKVPRCLSRFADYPPGPGKLGFPRCLFENPFPLNSDFWLKDIDLTCVSPWNDSHGTQRAGTAISKRHLIFAKHFPVSPGNRMAFVGEFGDVSHYSIKAVKSLATCDIQIALLDYELTPDVHPAKVLPPDYEKWLTADSRWPVVTFNQKEQVFLSELHVYRNDETGEMVLENYPPEAESWKKLAGLIICGDSGDPAFLLYRGKPVLLYCLSAGGAGHGMMIHKRHAEVQQAMDDLCPGYKLEEFAFGR